MKKLCIRCMCLLLIGTVSPAIANLEGIHILSEQYHVWGGYSIILIEPPLSGSYDSASNSDISDEVLLDTSYYYTYASSSAGRGGLSTTAMCVLDGPGSVKVYSYAESMLRFQPITSETLTATIFASTIGTHFVEATLRDTTTGTNMLDEDFCGVIDRSYYWSVDQTHEYELHMYTSTDTVGDMDPTDSYVSIGLSIVPIPAPSAIILASIGIGCVRYLRRKEKI